MSRFNEFMMYQSYNNQLKENDKRKYKIDEIFTLEEIQEIELELGLYTRALKEARLKARRIA